MDHQNHRQRQCCLAVRPTANRWVFVLLMAATTNVHADTLKVGSLFPTADFLQSGPTSDKRLASLAAVQEKKAIVFVFASW